VATDDDAIQVERVFRRDRAQVVSPEGNVGERVWPTAAVVTHAAILDAPDGDAAVGDRLLERGRVCDVELRQPTPAVDEHEHGVRPGLLREAQIAELQRAWTICDALVRRRRGERREI
jgi:hypothetical protein